MLKNKGKIIKVYQFELIKAKENIKKNYSSLKDTLEKLKKEKRRK